MQGEQEFYNGGRLANENSIIGIRKGAAASAPLESGHYEQAVWDALCVYWDRFAVT